jgi:hypothetical protein
MRGNLVDAFLAYEGISPNGCCLGCKSRLPGQVLVQSHDGDPVNGRLLQDIDHGKGPESENGARPYSHWTPGEGLNPSSRWLLPSASALRDLAEGYSTTFTRSLFSRLNNSFSQVGSRRSYIPDHHSKKRF